MADLKIDNGDWVVICDGAKALVLENSGTATNLILKTKEVYGQPDPATHELGTDKPGRTSNPGGSGHSAMEQTDWHDQEEQKFLGELAKRLDKAARNGEARALIVVAPPRALGVLRRQYSAHIKTALKAELEKDYVKMPVDEIERHLAT